MVATRRDADAENFARPGRDGLEAVRRWRARGRPAWGGFVGGGGRSARSCPAATNGRKRTAAVRRRPELTNRSGTARARAKAAHSHSALDPANARDVPGPPEPLRIFDERPPPVRQLTGSLQDVQAGLSPG